MNHIWLKRSMIRTWHHCSEYWN